jgi:hypothetical protein
MEQHRLYVHPRAWRDCARANASESERRGSISGKGLTKLYRQALTSRYNITDTKVFNLAYGGATIDSKLVTPYEADVQSIVTQVGLFERYLAPKPTGAHWNSSNSLFAFWIGINDVGNSFYWVHIVTYLLRPNNES